MGIFKLFENRHRIISVIGMSKNSGKTVTLNHIIEQISSAGQRLGLTSIGRDGETVDLVTQTDKPRVYVYEDSVVATAEQLFNLAEAKLEILKVTDHITPMGKIVIARAMEDGYVQIGGPASNIGIRQVAQEMLDLGADYILVDGALDRASTASPLISDSCVLATGAAVNRYMQTTVKKTVHLSELFKIKKVSGISKEILEAYFEQSDPEQDCIGPAILDLEGNLKYVKNIKTALGAGADIAIAADEDTRFIFIRGALVAKTIRDFVQSTEHYKNIKWVIWDATRIFIDPMDWKNFARIGVQISVVREVNLLAITVNPSSPAGHSYDSKSFIEALKCQIPEIPVLNVLE